MYASCTTTAYVHTLVAPLLPMYTCYLHHYCPRTHASCTTTAHVHLQKTRKIKIAKGYGFSGRYFTVWPPIASHLNYYYLFLAIKEGVGAPFQEESREHINSTHFNIPLLPQYFATTLWVWARMPSSSFANPFHFPRENWRGEEHVEAFGAWWRGSHDQVQGEVSISCCKQLFVRLI